MPLFAELMAAASRLVPEYCPRCGMAAVRGYCGACRADFGRIADPCPRCGLPAPCGPCPGRAPGWLIDSVVAPFAYADPLAGQLQALKYGRQRRLGTLLGQLLADVLGELPAGVEALLPVPLHPRRLRQRSFNQADEIARPLARRFGLPLLVAGFARCRDTETQSKLDRRARLDGLNDAFRITQPDFADRNIAIVDDVVTTGATINALAAALAQAGAGRITAIALARTTGMQSPQPAANR
jgi:ComF family protein